MILSTLIPLTLDKNGYADYGQFKFWASYITIFHLGFINGYNLKYGSKSMDELKSGNIPIILRFYIYTQLLIFVFLLGVSYIVHAHPIYKLVILQFIIHNINSLFIKMFTGTMTFKKYAIQNTSLSIIQVLVVVYFYYNKMNNAYLFMYLSMSLELIKLLIGGYTFKSVLTQKGTRTRKEFSQYISVVLMGLPMMLAVYVANIALGLDKIFIQNYYPKHEYANYTFAYEFVLIIYGVAIIANDVIIPYLLRYKGNQLGKIYIIFTQIINLVYILSILFMVLPALYVQAYNPQYIDALTTYYILYVVILFKLQYNGKFVPFYTYLKKGNTRLLLATITFVIALGTNLVVHFFYRDYVLFAVATIITFFIWNLLSDWFFSTNLKITVLKENIFQLYVITIMFIIAYNFSNQLIFYSCLSTLVISSIVFYRKLIMTILKSIRAKKNFLLID